jgi:Iron-sulfur binding domain of endonuclease III
MLVTREARGRIRPTSLSGQPDEPTVCLFAGGSSHCSEEPSSVHFAGGRDQRVDGDGRGRHARANSERLDPLVRRQRAGETGALLCTARRPRCDECPLREFCRARAEVASSGWPQRESKTPSFRYEDSNRYYRGRVLAELREISYAGTEVIDLRELGRRVRPDFDERETSWLHVAVESLCKDGLVKISSRSGTAVMPEAVAEGPSTYGVGPAKRSLEQRVSLP